jgi:hypothetical protein
MDHIWFARIKLIYEAVLPDPVKVLKCIKATFLRHLVAWSTSGCTDSAEWLPPSYYGVS